MKKFLTYLGLLITLVMMSGEVKADNMYARFYRPNAPANLKKYAYEMNHDGGGTAWHYDFYTTDDDWINESVLYVRPRIKDNNYDMDMQSPDPGANGTNENGAEYNFYKMAGDNIYDYKITLPDDHATTRYKVTVYVTGYNNNKSDPSCKVKVSWVKVAHKEESITLRTDAYKRPNNTDWIDIKYNEWDSENNIYIWYLDAISNFSNSSNFELRRSGTKFSNGGAVGDSWTTLYKDNNSCTPTIPGTTAGQIVRLEAKKNGLNWDARIVAGDGAHEYYWVSPQITNNQKWPSFRMEASRNRYWGGSEVIGDGLMSTKYYTFTIKDDDLVTWKTKSKIATGTTIQWYIVRDDDVVVYRPKDDLAVGYTPHDDIQYDNDHPITGKLDDYVRFINYWNGSSYDGETAYKNVSTGDNDGSWSFAKGSYKAYTFNLNAEKGHVLYNYTTTGATIDANGYDLAGNWSTGVEVSISLNANDTKPMTKYWYKGKNSYESLEAYQTAVGDISSNPADSIVYKVNVDRPSGGWGGLYLVVFPTSESRNWDNHPAVLRPLITMGNNLDGRALHGALTTSNSEQSLNPEPESYYTGYTFSFNATTMTYRLEFHMPDATLSPGTEDGNLDFKTTTSEDITVVKSNASDGIHTTATQYDLGFGDNASFDLSESTKYTNETFNLTFDGSYLPHGRIAYNINGTTGYVDGPTIYVKVRGFDAGGNHGDIHTYQYTFHSKISCTPQGGLFINSAKLTISGGVAPYRYEIWYYPTKVENGEEVIDYTSASAAKLSYGTFSTGDNASSDNNYRISTPGFLKIIDANNNEVEYAEVGGGFDFTYSTSENYIRNTGAAITTIDRNDAGAYPNGADYWLARPDDLTRLVAPTSNSANWNYADGTQNITDGAHWSGDNSISYLHLINNTASQTINNLEAGTYTVQAIVRGGAMPVYLDLNDAQVDAITLDGNNVSTISPTGRCERLENMRADDSHGGWRKLEGTATPNSAGELKIAVRTHAGESIDLADVILLKDANTEGGFRTTASKSETDVALYDYRDRTTTKNNAYSFFDRGKNLNALVYADKRTVIAMDKSLLSDAADYKNVDRKHPFNVVATNGASDTQGVCEVLYLTDKGYGTDINGYIVDYAQPSLTSDPNYAKYGKSGYSFKANLPFTANKVVFDRPFTNVSQTTIMLPFSLTEAQLQSFFGSGVQIWKYTGYTPSTKTLKFEKATDLSANTPYILINASNILDSRVSGKNVEPKTISAHGTEGDQYNSVNLSYSTTVDNEGFYTGIYKYLLVQRTSKDNSGNQYNNYGFNASTGGFSYPKASGAALKPFRCYFSVPADETVTPAASLNVIFEDVVTGISSTETIEIGDNKVYSTNGILMNKDGNLDNLPKGVYIVNGKKYVVK